MKLRFLFGLKRYFSSFVCYFILSSNFRHYIIILFEYAYTRCISIRCALNQRVQQQNQIKTFTIDMFIRWKHWKSVDWFQYDWNISLGDELFFEFVGQIKCVLMQRGQMSLTLKRAMFPSYRNQSTGFYMMGTLLVKGLNITNLQHIVTAFPQL